MSSKLLVIGDVNGKIEEVFAKIRKFHEMHQFHLVIIVGNLFAREEDATEVNDAEVQALVDGKIDIPTSVYFSLGSYALPKIVIEKLEANQGELCPNLTILGRKVYLKTSDGFRICAVGGKYQSSPNYIPSGPYDPVYNDNDVLTAAGNNEGCDLLITNHWPMNIGVRSKARNSLQFRGLQSIAELCAKIKPRYHFSVSPRYFQREAFLHNGPAPRLLTHFMSLAEFNNPDEKNMFAFSLKPSAPPPEKLPDNCTGSPFDTPLKRKREPDDNFRHSNDSYTDPRGGYERKAKRRHGGSDRFAKPRECFFCLSNRETETHMITSLGDQAYMTIAKGPLPTREVYPELGMPCHMLIIPISHKPTLASLEEEERNGVEVEVARYRDGLNKFLLSKSDKLGSVTWVISRAAGMHLHWQYMPAPLTVIQQGIVEAAFLQEAENLSYPRFAKTRDEIESAHDGDHFKVMIWSEGLKQEMVMPIDQNIKFDLQFGRRVMAKLLGLERRANWKECSQTLEEETADAETFKDAFEKFDFTA